MVQIRGGATWKLLEADPSTPQRQRTMLTPFRENGCSKAEGESEYRSMASDEDAAISYRNQVESAILAPRSHRRPDFDNIRTQSQKIQ